MNMRFILLASLILTGTLSAYPYHISEDEALQKAQHFFQEKFQSSNNSLPGTRGGESKRTVDLTLAKSIPASYYAFNISDGDGFVLISSDSENPGVIGYADKGKFDLSGLPAGMKDILENAVVKRSGKITRAESSSNSVLHETAEWGQGYPYNSLCPEFDGEKAPTGCVATAMAIAMQYHQWPDYTRGGVRTDFYHPDLSMDFSDYTIDWDALNDKENPKFADEVAKLNLSTGLSVMMAYGKESSGAQDFVIGHELITYYAYAKGCQYIEREHFGDEEWQQLIKGQLDEVGPVLYCGGTADRHCFVIDGYDEEGLYHINWGWDGDMNGYFAFDFSNVGGMSFGENQGAVINIRPDKERKEYSRAFIPNTNCYPQVGYGNWNFLNPEIVPDEVNAFSAPSMCLNAITAYFTIGIVDKDDNIKKVLNKKLPLPIDGTPTYCGYPGTTLNFFDLKLPALEDGERYQIISMEYEYDENGNTSYNNILTEYSDDPKNWRIVLGGLKLHSYFDNSPQNSITTMVNVHVDEKVPSRVTNYGDVADLSDWSMKFLRGGVFIPGICVPIRNMEFEIIPKDNDGNVKDVEPVFADGSIPGYKNITLTLFDEQYDVNLKYVEGGSTRNDEGIDPDLIVEADGLVYKKIENGVAVIGYESIGDIITIPSTIEFEGENVPVTEISNSAFLYAPAKELIIHGSNIEKLDDMAFSMMENLENVSFIGHPKDLSYSLAFYKTPVKNVFLDEPQASHMYSLMHVVSSYWTFTSYDYGPSTIYLDKQEERFENDNVDFYLTGLPKSDDNHRFYFLFAFNYFEKGSRVPFKSYNVPGIGSQIPFDYISESGFPVREMWKYTLDKENMLLSIDDVIDDVVIDSVELNGVEIFKNEDGLYELASTETKSEESAEPEMNITLNYTVKGQKQLKTEYSTEYNNFLESKTLGSSGIESIQNHPEGNNKKSVYNLQGICIKMNATQEEIDNLPDGIYIIGGKKVKIQK